MNSGNPNSIESVHPSGSTAVDIDSILAHVKKPSRYIGHEFNAVKKDWSSVAVKVALVFPDLYEIGMSHHGLQILYHIINSNDKLLAERIYAPDKDLEVLLRKKDWPIFSLESRIPLADFDMVGITLPYELCYTNILTILDLGKIPFRALERDDSHPFIIGGGSGSFNPEPVADFFDAILLGDGEEAILEITDTIKHAKELQLDRQETLDRLTDVEGVYVPSLFEPQYDKEGQLLQIRHLKSGYEKVNRRILPDLESVDGPFPPLVPLVRIVHDRLGVEVARGCTRGCRFCQAGIIYRPVRERSADKVVKLAEQGITAGGFEELALLSLSTGDYSCLSPALGRLMDRFVKDYVSVSMPSMRVGTLTPEIMQQIKRVRKTGFTLAPEAGTDRLRQVINKGITEEDLLATCREVFDHGWKLVKFYFMFGLPTETMDDVKAISDLVRKATKTAAGKSHRINVSVATFVPKPHTPFQWEAQLSIEEGYKRIDLLKKSLPKNCRLKWHDPRLSFLEGVMSRGDRRLSRLIEEVWKLGSRLDAWTEHFNLELWQKAGAACDVDLSKYLRQRDLSEILPWQHLDTGVDESFLMAEFFKALEGMYTKDCRVHACQKCGACDFKTTKPVVQCKIENPEIRESKEDSLSESETVREFAGKKDINEQQDPVEHYRYRLYYSRTGDTRFVSHLELIQLFFQAFRRANMQLHFSQGFNPVPKVSFSQALPVGMESMAEYMDVDLKQPVRDEELFISTLNQQLPEDFAILKIAADQEIDGKGLGKILTCYKVSLSRQLSQDDLDRLQGFLDKESVAVSKLRKGKMRLFDLRKQVTELNHLQDGSIELIQISEQGKASSKPMEIIKEVFGLSDDEILDARIIKLWTKQAE
jgi:radical SAM family uncharacterized protein/radical SAM-linked protein